MGFCEGYFIGHDVCGKNILETKWKVKRNIESLAVLKSTVAEGRPPCMIFIKFELFLRFRIWCYNVSQWEIQLFDHADSIGVLTQ